jgi:LytR cell envelope-related transcriptional attenuator
VRPGEDGGVRPSRFERGTKQRRGRAAEAAAAVTLLAIGLVVASIQLRGRTGSPAPMPSVVDSATGAARPSDLMALSVTGSPNALLAVVGSGGDLDPAALVLAPGMTIVAPGQGETTTEGIQQLSGDAMRVAVSNGLGAWTSRFGVIDLTGLSQAIDRHGGLSVDLPEVVTVGSEVLGPGETDMTGSIVNGYLSMTDDAGGRWLTILQALLTAGNILQPSDLIESDDAEAAIAIVNGATGAEVEIGPTQAMGAASIAQQPEFDELVHERFGTPTPVPTFVQNGNGTPGIADSVAAKIVPAGFRIVVSNNADSFAHAKTEVIANGTAREQAAERAREALGVGSIQVSQVPSGLADVTIIVGKDFRT